MHRGLQILEIVELICSNVVQISPTSPRRTARTLAALARTCTIFSGPALDALWRKQTSLAPFLKLMPEDLFEPSDRPGGLHNRQWRLSRPIVATDWSRATTYAFRVRELFLSHFGFERTSDVLQAFILCCPSGFLFPRLRILTYPLSHPTPIRIFLPSTLEQISVTGEASHTSLSLLSALANSCPRLKSVAVSLSPESGHVNHNTCLLVAALHSLVSLTMDTPTLAGISHLGQLSTLTTLRLGSLPSTLVSLSSGSPPMFPRLRLLQVASAPIGPATALIRRCSNTPLVYLNLNFQTCPTIVEMEAFYKALRAVCVHASLESITLGALKPVSPAARRDDYAITGRSLDILTCFTKLGALFLTAPGGFDLDDPSIARLAAAWPNLKNLWLATVPSDVEPRLTLQSLRSLAEHCPNLRLLHINVDARSIPPTGPTRVVHYCLTSINVASSPISGAPPVARYISGLFPNVSEITTAREDEDNDDAEEIIQNVKAIQYHNLWKEVETQVPEFVATRAEEQAWGPI
ncbi:hypothetical protein MVEN_02329900 [Mycena venus]|uniref:F-box domain-containing protein n=1 Tax=Mycena venus TaxID=2733690 RepID=A0A8H6X3U0_9AGAR|nr:hypothetical protein MVEN_02329900 [Mycena venus]